MTLDADSISESIRNLSGSLVLVTSQSGAIASVVDGPSEFCQFAALPETSLTVGDLWPAEQADLIRGVLKRTVRERHLCTEELERDDGGNSQEIICIPQGPDRVMMIVRDLSAAKHALSRARKLAFVDEATGLPNREFLFSELQRITDTQRLKEGRAAVICVYVGQIDDHGYALNSTQLDELLKQLAGRLTSHLRGSNDDTITDFERLSVVARADYRHFCIVLPSIESGEDAEAVVSRVVEDLQKPVTIAQRTLSVRACGGVALFPQDANDPAGLFENALAAMEDARNDATSSYKFHSGTVRLRALQRQDLEGELRSALEHEMYALNFLPVVDVESNDVIIMEALLRWPETIIGTQPTRKVVRVAERTGLIIPIGDWVVREACRQLQAWRDAGHANVRLAINLSLQELASDGIADRIANAAHEAGVDSRDLDLEIKEHMLVREALRDFAACKELARLGARVTVDDYGIGACSLAQLSQGPVGAIKIDNTIVAQVSTDPRDGAACAAAIAVARELGLDVIAEGVERDDQAQTLLGQGCHLQQGFLYSRPMNETEALEYLAAATRLDSGVVG